MKKILFFGDSITEANRQFDWDYHKGWGYASLVSSYLGYEYPGEYEFINRGISGNRVIDLLARSKCDAINLKPDIMSILIGVNDVYHNFSSQNGSTPERYYELYSMLVRDIKAALPDIKLIILGPFVCEGRAVADFEKFSADLRKMEAYAKQVAEENGALFVPLWDRFLEKFNEAPSDYWFIDGIHPTSAGHEIIKREWLKAFETIR